MRTITLAVYWWLNYPQTISIDWIIWGGHWIGTFKLCKNKRAKTRLRGLACNFLCTNKKTIRLLNLDFVMLFLQNPKVACCNKFKGFPQNSLEKGFAWSSWKKYGKKKVEISLHCLFKSSVPSFSTKPVIWQITGFCFIWGKKYPAPIFSLLHPTCSWQRFSFCNPPPDLRCYFLLSI